MSVHFINRRRKYPIEIEIGIGIGIEKTPHSMRVGCANMFFSSFVPAERGGALPTKKGGTWGCCATGWNWHAF